MTDDLEVQKEELAKAFVRDLQKRKLIHKLVSSLDREDILMVLSLLGERDALSYRKKSKDRTLAYIASKVPLIRAKDLEQKRRPRNTFLLVLGKALAAKGDLEVETSTDETVGEDHGTSLGDIFFTTLKKAIERFLEAGDQQNLFLTLTLLVAHPKIPFVLDLPEYETLLRTGDNISAREANKIVERAAKVLRTGIRVIQEDIDRLCEEYADLAKDMAEAAEAIADFGDLPDQSLFEQTVGLSKQLGEVFERLYGRYRELTGIDRQGKEQDRSLKVAMSLLEEIQTIQTDKGAQDHQQAHDLLDHARRLCFEGAELDEDLNIFSERIEELQGKLVNQEDLIEKVISHEHPVMVLLDSVTRGTAPDTEACKRLERDLSAFCGIQLAKSLVLALLLKQLSTSPSGDTKQDLVGKGTLEDQQGSVNLSEDSSKTIEQQEATEVENQPDSGEIPISEEVESPESPKGSDVALDDESAKQTAAPEPLGKTNHVETRPPPTFHTSQQSAVEVLKHPITGQFEALRNLTWHLLIEDKYALASHLALSVNHLYPDRTPRLEPWIVQTLLFGRHVRLSSGPLAQQLKQGFGQYGESCFVPKDKVWHHIVRLLLASAAMVPALIAPETGASAILSDLRMKDGLESLYEYIDAVASYGNMHKPLDPRKLKRVKDESVWQSELSSLIVEVDVWLSHASLKTFAYAQAGKVWRKWLEPGGAIHDLLRPVRVNDQNAIHEVRTQLKKMDEPAKIKELVEYTDRKVLKRFRGDDITAKAMGQLIKHAGEASDFASEWLELWESRPTDRKDFHDKQLEELKRKLDGLYTAVMAELDAFGQKSNSVGVYAGVECCRRTLNNIRDILNPETSFSTREVAPEYLLQAELLKIPAIEMDGEWKVISDAMSLATGLVGLIARADFDWTDVITGHSHAGDFEAVERVVEYLQSMGNSVFQTGVVKGTVERNFKEHQEDLKRALTTTGSRIEEAVVLGLIGEKERATYTSTIHCIAADLPSIRNFPREHAKLDRIGEALKKSRDAEIKSSKERMARLRLDEKARSCERLMSLLEKGDVLTANEYIELLEKKQEIPEADGAQDFFTDFFPNGVQRIYEFLADPSRAAFQTVSSVKDRKAFAGINMRSVTSGVANQAAEALDVWFSVKKSHSISALSRATVIPHPRGHGYSPLLPEMVVCYCLVLGLSFLL